MSTSHSLNPAQRALIALVTEEIADDDMMSIDESARQKNIETINKYMEEIKESDERLDKIKETAATETQKQITERELRKKSNDIMDIVKDLSVKKELDEFKTKEKAAKTTKESKPPTDVEIPMDALGK